MKGYYHKYFEGYEENKVLNRSGRGTHIEYTYSGYYFRQGIKTFPRILLRLLYGLMGLAAVGCLLLSSTRGAHCNQVPYMAVFQAVTMLLLIWFVWVLIFYICAPGEMTVYKYKSTALQILKVCNWLTAAFLLDAAGVAVDMVLSGTGMERGQMICLAGYLVGGVLTVGISFVERALPYERLSNDKEIIWYRDRMKWRY